MTPVFRRGTAADIGALHKLIESAYRGETARRGWAHEADVLDGQRTDTATLAQGLDDPQRCFLVAEDTGHIVACAELTDKGEGLAYVGLIAVDPRRQGDGMGRMILAEAERIAATVIHATKLEMTVIGLRTKLIAWYQRRGYLMTGETRPFPYGDLRFGIPKSDDLDFVVLVKSLSEEGYDQIPRVS